MGVFLAIAIGAALCTAGALILPLVRRRAAWAADARDARGSRLAAVAFAGAVPLAAAGLYLMIGAPELIAGKPALSASQIASLPPRERAEAISAMVARLVARLEVNPEDAEGWRMLARSYAALGENERSAGAWRELLGRVDGLAEDWRGYSAALIASDSAEDRRVELDAAMRRLAAIAPDDPLALYYLGETARAEGDAATAIAHWTRLVAQLPADAPVRPAIEKMIAEARTALVP
jgi:cytochrome c-type biogenesis protein CcmH